MHITGMSIGAIPPISDRITVKFDERVNVFIGPNASGKTTLLLALANHFKVLDEASLTKRPFADLRLQDMYDYLFDDYDRDGDLQFDALARSEDWMDPDANLDERPNDPIVVHVGSVRTGLPGVAELKVVGNSASIARAILAEPFNGIQVQRAFDALGKESWEIDPKGPQSEEHLNFIRAIKIADSCSLSICSEVIRDSETHHYVPVWDLLGYIAPPVANLGNIQVIRGAAINTNDVRDFEILPHEDQPETAAYPKDSVSVPIYLGHLSSGTEGTLLWIRWLAFKMLHYYGYEDGWEKQPGILLIDEIENHLHPTWQRRVIPALLEHFPGLQIFATTHSPFVVAGLRAGQVHMLNRGGDGVVTATTNEQDIIGWTTDEILRTYMGVDEPTDQLTVNRRERLLELRRQDALSDDEAGEMEELRRQVNEDFLSSSTPLEAQRERYGDMMLEFLRSRQSELSQDGG